VSTTTFPPSLFESIIQGETPGQLAIIHQDRLFLVDGANDENLDNNFVQLDANQLKFPLVETEYLKTIEDLDKKDHDEDLQMWQHTYTESKDFISSTSIDLDKQKQRIELYSLIINEVFPAFYDSGEKPIPSLDEVLVHFEQGNIKSRRSLENQNLRATLEDELHSLLGNSNKKKKIQRKQRDDGKGKERRIGYSLLGKQVLNRESFLFFPPNFVYEFTPFSAKIPERIVINNKKYSLRQTRKTQSQIIDQYNELRKEDVRKEAYENKPLVMAIREVNIHLDRFLQDNNFQHTGLGVIEHNPDLMSVTLKNPQFINIGEDNNYFLFPEMTIQIQIALSKKGDFSVGAPQIIEKVMHPFLQKNKPNQTICLERYRPQEEDKAAFIVKWLNISQNIIQCGYNRDRHTFRPYHKLDAVSFKPYLITKQEAERLQKSGEAHITNY